MNLIPKFAFFVAGTGTHSDRLHAFEKALQDAGPIAHNLVAVSSILPVDCEIITPEKGFKKLTLGAITFCVMAREDTDVAGRWASASVGAIKNRDSDQIGYVSEFHGDAAGEAGTAGIARRLALEMFETKFGTSDSDHELERLEDATASIRHPGGDVWVSAVALCIFVL